MSPLLLLLSACGIPVIAPSAPDAPGRSPGSVASTRTVDCSGGADHTTIAAAMAAAADGDEILVAPCTYEESIDFDGKRLVLRGDGDPADIIIDGGGGSATVTAEKGEAEGTAVIGMTLVAGRGSYGSAVAVTLSSLRLEDVSITGGNGAIVVYAAGADLELADVEIVEAGASQAILYLDRGTVVGDGIAIECDRGYGVYLGHGAAWLDDLDVQCGRQTAIGSENTTGQIMRATVEGNISMVQEDDHTDDTIRLENVIVEGNLAQEYGTFQLRNSIVVGGISLTTVDVSTSIRASVITGASCGITADSSDFTVTHTAFWENDEDACNGGVYVGRDGNTNADPRFTDADAGDYSLLGASPLINAGPNEDGWADADGSRNDIGVYGGPHALGGGI